MAKFTKKAIMFAFMEILEEKFLDKITVTSACNLHCTGCWAAEYGNKLNLTFAEMEHVVEQGKELGVYFYMFTG